MSLTFTNVLIILATFSFLIVASYQLFDHRNKSVSRLLLTAFLIANIAGLLNFLFMSSEYILSYSILAYIGNTISILAGPILFFYTKSLVDSSWYFTPSDYRHLVPIVGIFGVILYNYHIQPQAIRIAILTDPNHDNSVFSIWIPVTIFIYIFYYILSSLIIIRHFQNKLTQQLSSVEDYNLKWLFISMIGIIALFSMEILYFITINLLPIPNIINTLYPSGMSLFLFSLSLYFLIHALRQNAPINLTEENIETQDKYGLHRLSDHDLSSLTNKLLLYLSENHPENNSHLTLNDLALHLPMTPRELSQVINRSFNKSFFDFINERRVDNAQVLLLKDNAATITQIMLDCGFLSKSAFYSAFRKNTGTTPKNFQKLS